MHLSPIGIVGIELMINDKMIWPIGKFRSRFPFNLKKRPSWNSWARCMKKETATRFIAIYDIIKEEGWTLLQEAMPLEYYHYSSSAIMPCKPPD